ncbi:glycosyl transferases group 1 family protein [Synechococcus sp. RS9915]|nr:glycosyl transferases group 1 family protein [Synechococcus sp. RS9915]
MSVLYVSHGHPAFAKGGGELAAWRLFEAFRHRPGFEGSGFLAAASSPDQLPAGSEVVGLGPDEWLIKRSTSAITHATAVNLSCGGQLHQALARRRFQIIHLHHYLHVGIDLVLALKRWFPQAKMLLTLHDYWGPCVYEGRLSRASGELCAGGDPVSCDQCLGGDRRGELAIRALRLQRTFEVIDQLLCPSFFLKQLYLEWGVDPKRISVIENLPAPEGASPSPVQRARDEFLVVGFFGQVNPWKGLDLLIEAVGLARDRGLEVQLEVNGAEQPKGGTNPGVQFNGSYEPHQLAERMARVDVVAMASSWYENSPMVIQESFLHGRPVVAPRLGGMAEKIRDGQTGLLVQPGSVTAMAEVMLRLADQTEFLTQLQQGVQRSLLRRADPERGHAQLYRRLMN